MPAWPALRAASRALLAAIPSTGPFVVRLYQGSLDSSGEPLSVLYCGEERYAGEFSFFWSRNAEVASQTHLVGNLLRYAALPAALQPLREQADVVLRRLLPWSSPSPGELLHYPFLDATLRLASTVEGQIAAVRSKAQRRRLHKLWRRREYSFRVSKDASDFNFFYDALYGPYVRTKFANRAQLDGPTELKNLFRRAGHLLLISQHGRQVCGALLFPRADALCYHRNGFMDGASLPPQLLAERTAALELALFEHAIHSGFRVIDLGFTRAVLSDGLFVHKRRLGCSFSVARYSPAFAMRIRASIAPWVLSTFPILAGGRKRLVAHLGYRRGQPSQGARRWKRVVKTYAFPGLAGAVLHTDAPAEDPGRIDFETALRRALREVTLRVDESGLD